jgi:uncharacterized protein (DUF488 family)
MDLMNTLYTIGHSNHSSDAFIHLLKINRVDAVADVRSSPYSRHNPQFNRETIVRALAGENIAYVFLGKELGPRSEDPSCYENGRVSYLRLAEKAIFREGLARIRKGVDIRRIALMCAEKDPVGCHRFILVCRYLSREGIEIVHILDDVTLEPNGATERRLLRLMKIPELQLFESTEELIRKAYDLQGERIAYAPKTEEDAPDDSEGIEYP